MSILIGLAHEPVFNAAMATQVVFQQPDRDSLVGLRCAQPNLRGYTSVGSGGVPLKRKAPKPDPTFPYFPATVMRSISTEPVRTLPRVSTSQPTATIWRNMSRRLPAMVTSCTGNWISPFSTQ